ncbi:MAG: PP0621 family protein [Comamonas sp.]|uniref:PP0621 family protein n=1 Tax=Comamonas aquatilis TaxID=1778406 RepID=UPI0039F0BA7C
MKFLLVLLVIVVAVGIWRSKRRKAQMERPQPAAGRKLAAPQDMVECAHCGVHLPRAEALTEKSRFYCSAEHQAQAARR